MNGNGYEKPRCLEVRTPIETDRSDEKPGGQGPIGILPSRPENLAIAGERSDKGLAVIPLCFVR